MRAKAIFAGLALLLASATGASAQPAARRAPSAPALAPSSAAVTFGENGVRDWSITNRSYELVTEGAGQPMLLLRETTARFSEDEEDHESRVSVRAFGRQGNAFSRRLWTVEAPGEEAQVWGDRYLRVTREGCCTVETTHTLYALETGRPVVRYTNEALDLWRDEWTSPPVLVAFESSNAWTPSPEIEATPDAAGILLYMDGGSVTDRVLLVGEEVRDASPALALADSAGAATRREGVRPGQTLRVRVEFNPTTAAIVPVRDGRFLLDQATLPAGVTATRPAAAATAAGTR